MITLDCHQAEAESLVVDGKARPAWRCGLPFGVRGIEWVSWTGEARGAGQTAGAFDVLVQSHALQRLYERVPVEQWVVQEWLWQSLNWPVLTTQRKGQWLVEFRLAGRRLGYFAAAEVGTRY